MKIFLDVILLMILYFIWIRSISMLMKVKFPLFHMIIGGLLFMPTAYVGAPLSAFILMIISYVIAIVSTKDYKKSFISILFSYFILILVDCCCSITIVIFSGLFPIDSILFVGLINLFVDIVFYIFMRSSFALNFFQALEVRKNKLYLYFLFISSLFFLYLNLTMCQNVVSVTMILIALFFVVILTIYLYTKETMMQLENDQMMKLVASYEEHLMRVRQINHENRNLLLVIRSMSHDDSDAVAYIDTVLKEQRKDDYEILKQVINIPQPSLQALLYHKLLVCKEKKIPVLLHISYDLKKDKKIKVDVRDCLDMAKILGVFLDNAIEESEKVKEKNINIYFYVKDGKWVFQISNTFETEIHIKEISKPGYSTKGEGRGYGLSLVQRVVLLNPRLHTRSEIYEDVFIQYLEFDMKKN